MIEQGMHFIGSITISVIEPLTRNAYACALILVIASAVYFLA